MRPSLDRTLKWIWLAIGVLLMVTLVAALVFALAGFLRTRGASDAAAAAVGGGTAAAAAVELRASLPEPIDGTTTRIVFLERVRGGHAPAPGAIPGRRGGIANVAFVDGAGRVSLLLDRAAYIREVRYPVPAAARSAAGTDVVTWLTYEIAFEDTDGDGTIDERDAIGLYVGDLEGRDLRPVVEPPLRLRAHRPFGDARIVVQAEEPGGGARAFLYDVATGRVEPFTALDSAVALAGRIARGDEP
jgi:hypothetical protein